MTLVNINNAGEFNGSHLVTLLSMFRYLAHIFLGALQQHSCGFFKSLNRHKEHYKLVERLTCDRCDECAS